MLLSGLLTRTSKALTVCALTTFSQFAYAQSSPAELKTACETSPGNIVTLNQSTKIASPVISSTPLQVNCGCTIILNNQATFEFELSSMSFAGAFSVQSTGKGELKLTNSILRANSVSINLAGEGSSVATSQSVIRATAGNTIIALGRQAKMELYGRVNTSIAEGLAATGVVRISAGERFTGSIADMNVNGRRGIQIAATGIETLLKVEKVNYRSDSGSVSITANGSKGLLEMIESTFSFKGQSTINFSGAESGLKINQTGFFGPNYNVFSTGGVAITAGNMGAIEMSRIETGTLGGGFSASAGMVGEKGVVKLEGSNRFSVNGNVVFQTGNIGTTEVKDNYITSLTKIVIKAGAGGSCLATPNRALSAPIVETCLGFAALVAPNANPTLTAKSAGTTLKLFPNPSLTNSINVDFGSLEAQDIQVIDLSGRVVKQWKSFSGNTLLIDNLSSGLYNLLSTNNATGVKNVQKFVIN